MGQMRFQVPFAERMPEGAAERSYLAGFEGIPWRSRTVWTQPATVGAAEFLIERSTNESGNFYIPWKIQGRGEITLSTASLMERPGSYLLPLELARGTLNRLRNQAAEWQSMGIRITESLLAALRGTAVVFSQAVTSGENISQAATLAEETIGQALQAMDGLCALFSEQTTLARQSAAPKLPTFLAIRLDSRPLTRVETQNIAAAFNSAMIAFNWREIQFSAGKFSWDPFDAQLARCREHGLRILGGPLLQLDKLHTPDWLYIWEDEFDQVQASVLQYIRAVVERYRGKVHVWNCAARMNLGGAIRLNEEERLRLVVAVIDEVQRLDPCTPCIISFDQPWAEYLATADHDFSPLHFADSLVRGELGLAGIALEMNFGYWPYGSQLRDILEMNRLFDRWSSLGLPLLVSQTIPSGHTPDEHSRVAVSPSLRSPAACFTLERQRDGAEQLLRLLMAKSCMHGYIWQDVSDTAPHEFAHGGLLDARSQPKPVLQTLAELRRSYLS